jgi:hypothetical protein
MKKCRLKRIGKTHMPITPLPRADGLHRTSRLGRPPKLVRCSQQQLPFTRLSFLPNPSHPSFLLGMSQSTVASTPAGPSAPPRSSTPSGSHGNPPQLTPGTFRPILPLLDEIISILHGQATSEKPVGGIEAGESVAKKVGRSAGTGASVVALPAPRHSQPQCCVYPTPGSRALSS